MFDWLPPERQAELAALARSYGQPLLRVVEMDGNSYLQQGSRREEVCMVIRRPSGRLLLMKRLIYPRDAYRLPTGGIEPGEGILEALQREILEETGLTTEVSAFLGAVHYRLAALPRFTTYAWLAEERGGTLGALDEAEQVEGFREIEVADLPRVADYLQNLATTFGPEIRSYWDHWGHFRAVVHRVVWERLHG